MTKKELNAMNGECMSYRLNEPMSWNEFVKMPDDIKVSYIKLIREKFRVPDRGLAEMFGVCASTVSIETRRLGLSAGKPVGRPRWDKEAFLAWVHGIPAEAIEETVEDVVEEVEEVNEPSVPVASCLPKEGTLRFIGNVDEIANTLRDLLCGANVRMCIDWRVEEDDG